MPGVVPQVKIITNQKASIRGFYSCGVEVPSGSSGAVIIGGESFAAGSSPVNFPSTTRGSYGELIVDATGAGYTATIVLSGGTIEIL